MNLSKFLCKLASKTWTRLKKGGTLIVKIYLSAAQQIYLSELKSWGGGHGHNRSPCFLYRNVRINRSC